MASNCSNYPFSGTPEELDEHVSIQRLTTPAPIAHLTAGGSTVKVTNVTDDQMEPQVEKKECKICHKLLAPSSYSRHVKDKHAGTQECVVCKKSYRTDSALENHQNKAHAPKVISYFECDYCDYKSMNPYYMTDHKRRQHAGHGSNSFVCNICYARKQNEHLLKKHMQQHVKSSCIICSKVFNSTKNLIRHRKVHEVKRCDECGKNFNAKKELRFHKQEHKKKKKKAETNGQGGNIEDMIERAEFILYNADNLE